MSTGHAVTAVKSAGDRAIEVGSTGVPAGGARSAPRCGNGGGLRTAGLRARYRHGGRCYPRERCAGPGVAQPPC